MLTYDTRRFLALRRVASTGVKSDHFLDATAASQLHELRTRASKLRDVGLEKRFVSTSSFAEFMSLFYEAWDVLATLDQASDPFALPPTYKSDALNEEVRWAAHTLLLLECGRRPPGIGNAVFHGLRGTGKTTMLQATGAIAAALLDRLLPLYWSYEENSVGAERRIHIDWYPSIASLVGQAVDLGGWSEPTKHGAGTDVRETARALASQGRSLLLLVDEFTELYFAGLPHVEALRDRGKAIMVELHTVCKRHGNVAALLAASKTRVDHYFRPDTSPRAMYYTYPELNNQIFIQHEIAPMRDASVLRAYAVQRYPQHVHDLPNGEALLDLTGGVARSLGNVVQTDGAWTPDVTADSVLASPPLFALFCGILSYVPEHILSSGDVPCPVVGMSWGAAVDVLKSHMHPGASDAEACAALDGWCDQGAFYRTGVELQVLVPATLRRFNAALRTRDDLNAARELALTLHGFRGGTPGHSSEALICKFIHTNPRVGAGRNETRVLKLDQATAEWEGGEKVVDVFALLGCVFPWRVSGGSNSSESDIDRVLLLQQLPGASGGVRVQVCALQLKTARMTCALKAGAVAIQRARDTRNIDDTTIAGILVKAERGLAKLLPALHACFPRTEFVLGDVKIFTSKAAAAACNSFVVAEPTHATAFQIRAEPGGAAIRSAVADGPLAFKWSACGGTAWIIDALPPAIAAIVPLIEDAS